MGQSKSVIRLKEQTESEYRRFIDSITSLDQSIFNNPAGASTRPRRVSPARYIASVVAANHITVRNVPLNNLNVRSTSRQKAIILRRV